MNRPDVDVVILTWNDGDPLLQAAIRSALESEDVDVRVVVVDNGSVPAASVVDHDRVTSLRSERNLGVAVGRTVGVASTHAPFVCLLDSDARLFPSTLSTLVSVLTDDDRVGLAAPIFEGQRPQDSGGRTPTLLLKAARALNLRTDYTGGASTGPVIDVDFAIGACQVFRREAWVSVRGLDTSYFYGPEDVDFCLRLKDAGWRVVQVPAAICVHPPRRRFKRLSTKRGLRHGVAVARHLWRHRDFRSEA